MIHTESLTRAVGTSDATHAPAPEAGHNGVTAGQIKAIIERVERLHEERKAILSDISDIYREAKGSGLHVKAIQQLVKIRAADPAKRAEERAILELYADAIGEAV